MRTTSLPFAAVILALAAPALAQNAQSIAPTRDEIFEALRICVPHQKVLTRSQIQADVPREYEPGWESCSQLQKLWDAANSSDQKARERDRVNDVLKRATGAAQ